jgi:hypothetical protein
VRAGLSEESMGSAIPVITDGDESSLLLRVQQYPGSMFSPSQEQRVCAL